MKPNVRPFASLLAMAALCASAAVEAQQGARANPTCPENPNWSNYREMRFTVQERVGQQIVDALDEMLRPHGVAVYLEAHHLCTQMRGVQEVSPLTRTTFWRGEYESNPALRSEFFVACGLHR